MITSLWKENNLRGYMFEYIAKVILRRENNNNFIFLTNQFDSIDEILIKYRLISRDSVINSFFDYLRKEWKRCDMIEFIHDDRTINKINIYDVKTKLDNTQRSYYEFCQSGFKFFNNCMRYSVGRFIISIVIYENWRFSFNQLPYENAPVRVYSRFNSKNIYK